MKNLLILLLLPVLLLPAHGFAQTVWKPVIYNVSFKIKNAGATVNGKFTGLNTDIKFSPDNLAASHLKGSVEVPTIKTGNNMRDKDLQHKKYFNSDKYKLIELSSAKLYRKGNAYAGLFNVTIKGVTKQMEIPFTFTQNGSEAEFKGAFIINRRDFGVGGKTLTMSETTDVSILIKVKS